MINQLSTSSLAAALIFMRFIAQYLPIGHHSSDLCCVVVTAPYSRNHLWPSAQFLYRFVPPYCAIYKASTLLLGHHISASIMWW